MEAGERWARQEGQNSRVYSTRGGSFRKSPDAAPGAVRLRPPAAMPDAADDEEGLTDLEYRNKTVQCQPQY